MFINIQLFGDAFPPVYGTSNFYEKKKAKLLKKKEKIEAEIKVCDEKINK